jgi:Tol biopolymer transport system component
MFAAAGLVSVDGLAVSGDGSRLLLSAYTSFRFSNDAASAVFSASAGGTALRRLSTPGRAVTSLVGMSADGSLAAWTEQTRRAGSGNQVVNHFVIGSTDGAHKLVLPGNVITVPAMAPNGAVLYPEEKRGQERVRLTWVAPGSAQLQPVKVVGALHPSAWASRADTPQIAAPSSVTGTDASRYAGVCEDWPSRAMPVSGPTRIALGIVDIAKGTVRYTASRGRYLFGPGVCPVSSNGETVATLVGSPGTRPSSLALVADVRGNMVTMPIPNRPNEGGIFSGLTLSPSGRYAYVSTGQAGSSVSHPGFFFFDLERRTIRRYPVETISNAGLWSPDSKTLVFVHGPVGHTRIALLNSTTGKVTFVNSRIFPNTNTPTDPAPIAFSPDGERLFFTIPQPAVSGGGKGYVLYSVLRAGTNLTQLTPDRGPRLDGPSGEVVFDPAGGVWVLPFPSPLPGAPLYMTAEAGFGTAALRFGN